MKEEIGYSEFIDFVRLCRTALTEMKNARLYQGYLDRCGLPITIIERSEEDRGYFLCSMEKRFVKDKLRLLQDPQGTEDCRMFWAVLESAENGNEEYYLVYGITLQLDHADKARIYVTVFKHWLMSLDYRIPFSSKVIRDVESVKTAPYYEDYCQVQLKEVNDKGFADGMMELLAGMRDELALPGGRKIVRQPDSVGGKLIVDNGK